MLKKIFIIEDDANILYSLQAKFSIAGFKTITSNGAESIAEVIGRMGVNKPDFIILDLMLPKFDGFDLLIKLNKKDETKNIPIFTFTNLSDADSKSRGVKLGVDHFFVKDDFSIDDFVDKVIKIIKNKY